MPDHVRLFTKTNPFDSPTYIVKIFKGVTSLRIAKKFPQLHQQLWRRVLWPLSYYASTAGDISAEVIEKYVVLKHM
jgi:putative transposase